MKKTVLSLLIVLVLLLSGCRSSLKDIDKTAPTITVNEFEEEFYIGETAPIISATCKDDVDETCLVTTPNYPDLSVHGEHIITFRAVDSSGNTEIITITVNAIDRAEYIAISIEDHNTTVELGSIYVFPVITCQSSESSVCTIEVPLTLDTTSLNPELTYVVTGTDDLENSRVTHITVEVVDTTNPVVALIGDTTLSVELGSAWTDPGVTTTDLQSVNVTEDIAPDTNIVGEYIITYTATDASGNISTVTRTVIVEDTTDPLITLVGDATYNITTTEGTTWVDPGVNTTDLQIVTVTQDITPDYTNPGTYLVTYTATDAAGNTATISRTVTVTTG